MVQRALALLLAFVILIPAVAFAADETPAIAPVGGAVEPGAVSQPKVRKVQVEEAHDIRRELAGGFLLGALVGGGVNQIGRMDSLAPLVLGGAAIGMIVAAVYHYTGRKALLTVDSGQMKLAMPVVLPDEQRMMFGSKDVAVKMNLLTINY